MGITPQEWILQADARNIRLETVRDLTDPTIREAAHQLEVDRRIHASITGAGCAQVASLTEDASEVGTL